jgi:hypothetical protein
VLIIGAGKERLPIILGNIDAPAKPKDAETAPEPASPNRSDADAGQPLPSDAAPDTTPSPKAER